MVKFEDGRRLEGDDALLWGFTVGDWKVMMHEMKPHAELSTMFFYCVAAMPKNVSGASL